jgi:hypothetical protein
MAASLKTSRSFARIALRRSRLTRPRWPNNAAELIRMGNKHDRMLAFVREIETPNIKLTFHSGASGWILVSPKQATAADGIILPRAWISVLARDFRRQKTLLRNPAAEEEPEGEQARVLSSFHGESVPARLVRIGGGKYPGGGQSRSSKPVP